jgi:hypothetical protein
VKAPARTLSETRAQFVLRAIGAHFSSSCVDKSERARSPGIFASCGEHVDRAASALHFLGPRSQRCGHGKVVRWIAAGPASSVDLGGDGLEMPTGQDPVNPPSASPAGEEMECPFIARGDRMGEAENVVRRRRRR